MGGDVVICLHRWQFDGYAGFGWPLTGPTLSYTVNGPLPAGSIGIGFYVNSTTPQGGTVTVAISLRRRAVDSAGVGTAWRRLALSPRMIGALTLRRRRARRSP